MASVKDFRELRVYRNAFESSMRVFRLSKAFPADERYSLTGQIRRSSRSVCANVAEAWRKRRYEAAFVSKLSDADTEAAETQVWLEFAHACEYIGKREYQELTRQYDLVCGQLVRMMQQSRQWCS
jgi:four helix bundle protein